MTYFVTPVKMLSCHFIFSGIIGVRLGLISLK